MLLRRQRRLIPFARARAAATRGRRRGRARGGAGGPGGGEMRDGSSREEGAEVGRVRQPHGVGLSVCVARSASAVETLSSGVRVSSPSFPQSSPVLVRARLLGSVNRVFVRSTSGHH
jgi:hypothetical protein